MSIDADTERQLARKARRDMLIAVVAAIAVASVGWYGFDHLSTAIEKSGVRSRAKIDVPETKTARKPVLVPTRPEEPERQSAEATGTDGPAEAPPAAVERPEPQAPSVVEDYRRLPPRYVLLEMSRAETQSGDAVMGGLLALAALPTAQETTVPPEELAALHRALYEAYLNRREMAVMRGHYRFVRSAVFSPDGKRIVTASSDRTARLWDAETGAYLNELKGHEAEVWSAVFSPDGRRVMTVSFDNTARLWDADSGDTVAVLRGHSGEVNAAAFSPDGSRMLTSSYDNTARVWDTRSAQTIAVLSGHENLIRSASFSADGKRVVTASRDRTARIWNAETGEELVVLRGHSRAIRVAAFSPDGHRVATASADGTARLWDAETGAPVAVLSGHDRYVTAAYFSPDGHRVITSAWGDHAARLWDAETGAAIAVLRGHRGEVNHASFSPDSRRVVTAAEDKTARLWDAATGAALGVLGGHENAVYTATFSPDGNTIVTASADGTARLWDARGSMAVSYLRGSGDDAVSAAFSGDGRKLVTESRDGVREVWDTASGARLSDAPTSLELFEKTEVSGISISVSDDGEAQLRTAPADTLLAALPRGRSAVRHAAISPDGTRAVTVSNAGTVRLIGIFPTLEGLAAHLEKSLPRTFTKEQRRELVRIANATR